MAETWRVMRERIRLAWTLTPDGSRDAWGSDVHWTKSGWESERGLDGIWVALVLLVQPDPVALGLARDDREYRCSAWYDFEQVPEARALHERLCSYCGGPAVSGYDITGERFDRMAGVVLGATEGEPGHFFMGFAAGMDEERPAVVREHFGLAGLAGYAVAIELTGTRRGYEYDCSWCYRSFRSATTRDDHVDRHRQEITAKVAAGGSDSELWSARLKMLRLEGQEPAEQPAFRAVRDRWPTQSWREIADALGVGHSGLSAALRGQAYPSAKLRSRASETFGLPEDQLFRMQPAANESQAAR